MAGGRFSALRSGAQVWLAAAALAAVSCSRKAGEPPTSEGPVDGGHRSLDMDARTLLPGIVGPPDAELFHPGEGGVRVSDLNRAEKVDLLFVVDDSVSMADKHEVLKAAIPDLLNRLVNPVCLDRFGATSQPSTADVPCPDQMSRQFAPVRDIHIGVITSSLGGPANPSAVCSGVVGQPLNDGPHWIASLPRGTMVATGGRSFL